MSLINRPDERRREEARIARANQIKPLVDPEPIQVVQGDSTFSRVTVPNSQLDDFSKNIMEILGPYHSVLGGPSVNGLRAIRVSELSNRGDGNVVEKTSTNIGDGELDSVAGTRQQPHSSSLQQSLPNSRQTNSSSVSMKPLGSYPPSGDSKRPSSLALSHCPSSHSSPSPVLPSKPTKPVSSNLAESCAISSSSVSSSSHHHTNVVSSSSSPAVHSPVKSIISKDSTTAPKESGGNKDVKHRLAPQTSPASAVTVKQKTSTSLRSPKTDLHQQHQHVSPQSSSKSRSSSVIPSSSSSSSSRTSKVNSRDVSPSSLQSSAPVSSVPATTSKDHNSGYPVPLSSDPPSPARQSPVTSSSFSVSNSCKLSPSASKSSSTSHISSSSHSRADVGSLPRPHSSFSSRTHLAPSPRPRSTTPTETKPHMPNGITTRHPKLAQVTPAVSSSTSLMCNKSEQSATASTAPGSSATVPSGEKKSLKVWIPNEIKMPASKSDLIDIIKEMTELHDPLTAIETPQKLDKEFPFYKAAADGQPRQKLFDDSVKKATEKLSDVKVEATETVKKEKVSPKKESVQVPSESSGAVRAQAADHAGKAAEQEEKHTAEPEKQEPLQSMTDNPLTETVEEPSRCSSSSSSRSSSSSKHRNIGKVVPDDNSILIRDLDLSEDSDVEPVPEDNTSECQSKKGKVMAPTAGAAGGGAPVKRAVSPMSTSSSNSSSSESSSESGAEDDDDDDEDDDNAKTNGVAAKKSSEGRLSSSSSSSSSGSESGSEEEEDGDDKKVASVKKPAAVTELKTFIERGEKTPSPPHRQAAVPGSVGTPSNVVHENSETNMSWRLEHFMHPKKNPNSPISLSPLKSGSPPLSHSAPPSVQPKDDTVAKTPDQSRPTTLREVGHCGTMSFDVQLDKVLDEGNDDDDNADLDDDNGREVLKRKTKTVLSSTKDSNSSSAAKSWNSALSKQPESRKCAPDLAQDSSRKCAPDLAQDSSRKVHSTESQPKASVHSAAQKIVVASGGELGRARNSSVSGSNKDRKENKSSVTNVNHKKLKTPTPLIRTKPIRPGSSSSSNDEIDVESFTPDEKGQQRLMSNPDNKIVDRKLAKKLFLSEGSDEEWNSSPPGGSHVEVQNMKYRRKARDVESQPSNTNVPVETSSGMPSGTENKTSKKDSSVALDHLEAISKPPNLLSPLHSSYSSPSVTSTKPLPSFHTSFSPLHSSTSAMPPYVTLSRNPNGTSRPRIVVQIRHNFLDKKLFAWLRDKRKRRKNAKKEGKGGESSKCDTLSGSSGLVPRLEERSSQGDSGSIKEDDAPGAARLGEAASSSTAHSKSSHPPKLGKHKSRDFSSPSVDDNTEASLHNKIPKHTKSSLREIKSSTSTAPSGSEPAPSTLPSKSPSRFESSSAAAQNSSSTLSQNRTDKLTPATSNPNKSSLAESSVSDGSSANADSKSDKTKLFKRKLDITDEASPRKSRPDLSIEKGGSAATNPVGKRRDSTASTSSKESHQSTSSKKNRRTSVSKDMSSNNSVDEAGGRVTNGPDSGSLPFNLYVNGTGGGSSNGTVGSRAQLSSSSLSSSVPLLPANLPPPSPVETQLHSTKHYLARAREHKHHADNLKDKLAKYEPYLRSGLSFFLAGYSMELSKRELGTSYSMYNDTSNLLQYVIRMRANSSSNPESSDRDRKLIVLIIRLQAYLNHRLYRLRRTEVSKLKKVIESEQTKYHSTSASAASTSSSTNASSNAAVTSKPHAPSPHQNNWNKNSTGTPSPMSPTPSPAGSVSSQGSCEIVTGKIPNGNTSTSSTPLTSPSPSMVSVHQRVHAVTQKYFILTSHMVKALELWDQADAESRGFEDFFNALDNACGPLSFHSEPPVVVRYMKYALRLLNL